MNNRYDIRTEGSGDYNLKYSKLDEVTVISLPLVLIGAF